MSFRYDNGSIVGYGLTLPAPSGVAFLTADHLNRLVDLLREQKALGDDDGARLIAQEKRERTRIEAAKADLLDDLGLDLTHGHGAHVEVRDGTMTIIGCVCGWRCSTPNVDDELAVHVAIARQRNP